MSEWIAELALVERNRKNVVQVFKDRIAEFLNTLEEALTTDIAAFNKEFPDERVEVSTSENMADVIVVESLTRKPPRKATITLFPKRSTC